MSEEDRFSKPRWCHEYDNSKSYTNEELKSHLLNEHSHEELADRIAKHGWSIT